jgi:hypothetical protein
MDYPSQRAMILLHEPKLYFAFPLEDRFWWGRVTQGLVADLNKTYKEGYTVKLIREENFMGFDCRVTQASWQANGARQEVFFWLPHDLQGVSLKTQVSQDGHLKMEAQLSGIQKRDFEESFFQKPADYARALDQNTNFEEAGKAKSQ